MKRGPRWGERALVHVTLNTGDRQRFALVPENYDPGAIAQLQAALPKVIAAMKSLKRRLKVLRRED